MNRFLDGRQDAKLKTANQVGLATLSQERPLLLEKSPSEVMWRAPSPRYRHTAVLVYPKIAHLFGRPVPLS